jgi:hypothetical protein
MLRGPVDTGRHLAREPALLHQFLVEPAIAALSQQLVDDAEGVPFRRVSRGDVVAHRDGRFGALGIDFATRRSSVCRGSEMSGFGGCGTAAMPAKYFSIQRQVTAGSKSPTTTRAALLGA